MKRAFDILAALVGLVVLSPVLVAAAVAILVCDGRPVLFRQPRPGRHGRIFRIVKFRTMTVASGPDTGDTARITRLGRVLRSTSIDELPELWNVLLGDMSIVGPRPLLTSYLPLYSATQARRHEVRPGLTGLAQVSGRNGLGWDEKFALDVWYVDNRSFRLDLRIVMATVGLVVRRSNVDASGDQTMPVFTGNQTTPVFTGEGPER
ncbi:sugar transferase [Polymorphobacter multimanifer]|uniref:Lipopolysaccharide/colanic/teichoic acid biosynthesis glycosyltransferase n=1 Tax=Polymorphobacter multimanifer TaxID=1070431 RepID=A0A841LA72_9SPHN|nr:sugar transferase [Polymorphobacter multimanifer]MBB6228541.1 lipopolysaccharide/colanic/teichoic acid biosynthesis glycosyltransferase [Polymorphobacter multimanifer]GGI75370.1 sugar transferase [Polymorphobacter multimanifer]